MFPQGQTNLLSINIFTWTNKLFKHETCRDFSYFFFFWEIKYSNKYVEINKTSLLTWEETKAKRQKQTKINKLIKWNKKREQNLIHIIFLLKARLGS